MQKLKPKASTRTTHSGLELQIPVNHQAAQAVSAHIMMNQTPVMFWRASHCVLLTVWGVHEAQEFPHARLH